MGRFFLFDSSRYFGHGPDSDLMMAPDDGYSIMTHPEGKEKMPVWLFPAATAALYLSRLPP